MNAGEVNVGLVSYLFAAVAYAVLALLMLTSWRGRLQGGLLVAACLVSVLWAAYSSYVASSTIVTSVRQEFRGFYLMEVARDWAWYFFLLKLLSPLRIQQPALAKFIRHAVPVVFILSLGILTLDILPGHTITSGLDVGGIDLRLLGHFGMAVIGLVLVEQLFRNTREDSRWSVKYLFLGLGSLFAYDFFMYADALLFHHLDYELWQARGFINAAIVPMLAVSVARNNEWSLDIFVSRKVVFHTVALLGTGLYLLAMSAASLYIRDYGGTWGATVQITFLFFAIVLLVIMLFSGQLRSRVKVLLNKHFFNYNYDYRDEWLKLSGTLAARSQGRDIRENAIKALADIIDSPGGLLFARSDAGHYTYSAHWNMDEGVVDSIADNNPVICFMEDKNWIVDLENLDEIKNYGLTSRIPTCLKLMSRAWLLLPLNLHQGEGMVGFVVLAKSRVLKPLDWEARDLLKVVALQIASHIALLKTSDELMIARQFDTFNRLSSYVVHDLKNITAQLSLIVANAVRFKHNQDFIADAFSTVNNAVNKMNRMLLQFKKGDASSDGNKVVSDIDDVLDEVFSICELQKPRPILKKDGSKCEAIIDMERLTNVVAHIVRNAQEATNEYGIVTLGAKCTDDTVVIEIEDDGCGMEAKFVRDRLFKPFDTTKGNAGMGIGVYECREFIWSQGGEIMVKSAPGEGTVFKVILPRFSEPEHAGMNSGDSVRLVN